METKNEDTKESKEEPEEKHSTSQEQTIKEHEKDQHKQKENEKEKKQPEILIAESNVHLEKSLVEKLLGENEKKKKDTKSIQKLTTTKSEEKGSESSGSDEEENQENTVTKKEKEKDVDAVPGETEEQKKIREMQTLTQKLMEPPNFSRPLSAERRDVLLKALQCDSDFMQLEAVMQLNEALTLSTEESLSGFQTKQFLAALGNLLNVPNNLELNIFSSRSMLNLLEALPASAPAFVRANILPSLCSKLTSSEVVELGIIDVAELAMQILAKLSETQAVPCLQAGALSSAFMFFCFYQASTARHAITLAANICSQLPPNSFDQVTQILDNLVSVIDYDKKMIEDSLLCFYRLTEIFINDEPKLNTICQDGLISKLIKVVSSSGSDSNISATASTLALRTMSTLCRNSATQLKNFLDHGLVQVLSGILEEISKESGRSPRSGQHILDIISLINDLLPGLPEEIQGFILSQENSPGVPHAGFPFGTGGRHGNPFGQRLQNFSVPPARDPATDTRRILYEAEPSKISLIGTLLLPPLFNMFASFVNSTVRYKCISAIAKIVHYSDGDVLEKTLKDLPYSRFIARLLADKELAMVAIAVFIAELSIEKLPLIFKDYFLREGVVHQFENLIVSPLLSPDKSQKTESSTSALPSFISSGLPPGISSPQSMGFTISGGPPIGFGSIPLSEPRFFDDTLLSIPTSTTTKSPKITPAFVNSPPESVFTTSDTTKILYNTTPFYTPVTSDIKTTGISFSKTTDTKTDTTNTTEAEKVEKVEKLIDTEQKKSKHRDKKSLHVKEKQKKSEKSKKAALLEELSKNIAVKPPTTTQVENTKNSEEVVTPKIAKIPKSDILREWIHSHATSFRNKHYPTQYGGGTKSEEFKQLSAISVSLKNVVLGKTDNLEEKFSSIQKYLLQIAELLTGGISDFEFGQSGCTSSLLLLLTHMGASEDVPLRAAEKDRKKRIQLFTNTFLATKKDCAELTPFHALLKFLEHSLSSNEQLFPVFLNGSSGSGLKILLQPFKFNLIRDPEETRLYPYEKNYVHLEPLATVHNLEKFLVERTTKPPAPSPPPPPPPSDNSTSKSDMFEALKKELTDKRKTMEKISQRRKEKTEDNTTKKEKKKKIEKLEKKQPKEKVLDLKSEEKKHVEDKQFEEKKSDEKHPQSEKLEEKLPEKLEEKQPQKLEAIQPEEKLPKETQSEEKYPEKSEEKQPEKLEEKQPELEKKPEQILPESEKLVEKHLQKLEEKQTEEKQTEIKHPEKLEEKESEVKHPEKLEEKQPELEEKQPEKLEEKQPVHSLETEKLEEKKPEKIPSEPEEKQPETSSQPEKLEEKSPEPEKLEEKQPEKNPQPEKPTVILSPEEHIGIFLDGIQLDNRKTFFQIIQQRGTNDALRSSSGGPSMALWEKTYDLIYKILPKSPINCNLSQKSDFKFSRSVLDEMFSKIPSFSNSAYSETATLLWLLYNFNELRSALFKNASGSENILDRSEFFSAKLSNKLSRQIQDPLTLCSGALPDWCELAELCYCLFSFEKRLNFFKSTSFGIARALKTLTSENFVILAERSGGDFPLPRHKFRIDRKKVLQSAVKVMEMCLEEGVKLILQVEFFGEPGVGLGPTKEFYTIVSNEIQKKKLDLWLISPDAQEKDSEFVYSRSGLFPKPLEMSQNPKAVLEYFNFLGKFVAKAILDERLLDIPFSVPFYKLLLGERLTLRDLVIIKPEYVFILDFAKICSMKKKILASPDLTPEEKNQKISAIRYKNNTIENMDLTFSVPTGNGTFKNLKDTDEDVTIHNLDEYVQLVAEYFLYKGVQHQLNAFTEGFSKVLPLERLRVFTAEELDVLICGIPENMTNWTYNEILESAKFGEGYSASSRVVSYLINTLVSFTVEQRRRFLQFLTGSPRLPVGGLRSMRPKFTIQRKTNLDCPDHYLPSVNTCFLFLKLPEYSSEEITREKLLLAMDNGHSVFEFN